MGWHVKPNPKLGSFSRLEETSLNGCKIIHSSWRDLFSGFRSVAEHISKFKFLKRETKQKNLLFVGKNSDSQTPEEF